MEPMWLDRELADKVIAGVDKTELNYDPDTGQYCLRGEPFTGVVKTRWPDGRLDGLGHLKDGVEDGVSVGWYPNGQIEVYSEMKDDVFDGWHLEWDEDGTKRVEEFYRAGLRAEPAASNRLS
jgi:antitoxin component YwqK of YwqJK toxin-antitoxin module